MLHATPAPLPHNAAGIVRLLSAQNTSGRATWNVVVKKDGTRYRLDYAWRGSNEVSIHVLDGKRELWAATRGTKAQYVCSRMRPAQPTCKANPAVNQVTPIFLAVAAPAFLAALSVLAVGFFSATRAREEIPLAGEAVLNR